MHRRYHIAIAALVFFFISLPLAGAVISVGTISIYAVTSSDDALEAHLTILVKPGTGKIWSSVGPLVGTSTQHTERISVSLAKNYFDSVDSYDYHFDINSNASIVEGPSAGAAMALLLVSMLQDKPLPDYVAVTGQIAEDGTIGPVGGVFEKAKKASDTGKKIFLIPEGEAFQMHKFPDGVKTVNLVDYAFSEWGIKVLEVQNIDEALELAFTKPEDIDVNREVVKETKMFVPEQIEIGPGLEPMRELTEKYLKTAGDSIEDAKGALNTSPINDSGLISLMVESLSASERTLEDAKLLHEKNYLYSSANYAFIVTAESQLVKDLAENPSLIESNSTVLEVMASDLEEQLKSLELDLNEFYSQSHLEWIIAARQRLSWAKVNVNSLLKTKTIVISSTGQPISDIETAIEKLRDYEYAKAWFGVSEDFLKIAKKAEDKIVPASILAEKAEEYVMAAENELALAEDGDVEDMQRRLDAAKSARRFGWNDSALFDAASAIAIARSEKAISGKSLGELNALLGQKLTRLNGELTVSDQEFLWAKLYFDHARYFFNLSQYFREQNNTGKAIENAKSGVRLAFFAEEMLSVTKLAREELKELPMVDIYSEPLLPGGGEIPLLPVAAFFAVVLGITVVLVWSSALHRHKRPEEAHISRRMQRLERLSHQTDRARLRNKLGEEEHKRMSAGYESMRKSLEEEKKLKSKHIIELDRLHGEIGLMQHMLQELAAQYKSGQITDSDYREVLDSLTEKLKAVKVEATGKEAMALKAPAKKPVKKPKPKPKPPKKPIKPAKAAKKKKPKKKGK